MSSWSPNTSRQGVFWNWPAGKSSNTIVIIYNHERIWGGETKSSQDTQLELSLDNNTPSSFKAIPMCNMGKKQNVATRQFDNKWMVLFQSSNYVFFVGKHHPLPLAARLIVVKTVTQNWKGRKLHLPGLRTDVVKLYILMGRSLGLVTPLLHSLSNLRMDTTAKTALNVRDPHLHYLFDNCLSSFLLLYNFFPLVLILFMWIQYIGNEVCMTHATALMSSLLQWYLKIRIRMQNKSVTKMGLQ